MIGYYSSHVENRALVISMEYAAGGTLAEYIASTRLHSTHLPEFEVADVGEHYRSIIRL